MYIRDRSVRSHYLPTEYVGKIRWEAEFAAFLASVRLRLVHLLSSPTISLESRCKFRLPSKSDSTAAGADCRHETAPISRPMRHGARPRGARARHLPAYRRARRQAPITAAAATAAELQALFYWRKR